MTSRRRFDVIMTLLLRRVPTGWGCLIVNDDTFYRHRLNWRDKLHENEGDPIMPIIAFIAVLLPQKCQYFNQCWYLWTRYWPWWDHSVADQPDPCTPSARLFGELASVLEILQEQREYIHNISHRIWNMRTLYYGRRQTKLIQVASANISIWIRHISKVKYSCHSLCLLMGISINQMSW